MEPINLNLRPEPLRAFNKFFVPSAFVFGIASIILAFIDTNHIGWITLLAGLVIIVQAIVNWHSQKPVTITDTIGAISDYLDAGASVTQTADMLRAWGYIATLPGSTSQGGVINARLLPTNDSQVIAVLYDPTDNNTVARSGDLVVLKCASSKYQLVYRASESPGLSGHVKNPRVLSITDVTGDGVDDLSYTIEDCSAGNCYDGIYILRDLNGELSNAIPDYDWVPAPGFEFFASARDQPSALYVHIGSVTAPEAGPQRAITVTWVYNGSIFTLTNTVKDQPVYRIQALNDADDLFRKKDYVAASALYQRVVNDTDLKSWNGRTPLRDEPAILAAFAMVRMMEVEAVTGDTNALTTAHETLNATALSPAAGALYAHLGEVFYTEFSATRNYKQACDAVQKFAEKNQNTYLILSQETFGSSSYDYQPVDMCLVP